MKLLEISWNYNLSSMTFLNNFPIVLSKIMGQKVLGISYDFLLGLGIMMVIKTLKYNGQYYQVHK